LKLANLSLKHLLYTDDLLILIEIDDRQIVLEPLKLFCDAPYLETNKNISKRITASKHRIHVNLPPFEGTQQEKF